MKNLSRFAISLRFVTDYKSSHQFLPKGPINSVDWTFDRLHSPIDDPENSEVFLKVFLFLSIHVKATWNLGASEPFIRMHIYNVVDTPTVRNSVRCRLTYLHMQ
jgi:hypothetical protein